MITTSLTVPPHNNMSTLSLGSNLLPIAHCDCNSHFDNLAVMHWARLSMLQPAMDAMTVVGAQAIEACHGSTYQKEHQKNDSISIKDSD